MEIELPFEMLISGTPLSLQASPQSRERWKDRLAATAREQLEGWEWLVQSRLSVQILHFADSDATADIDNIVKPILDALKGVIFQDDIQVDDLHVRRITPGGVISFANPTALQLEAVNSDPPCVYVRVALIGEHQV